jgi:hypothetical protein
MLKFEIRVKVDITFGQLVGAAHLLLAILAYLS